MNQVTIIPVTEEEYRASWAGDGPTPTFIGDDIGIVHSPGTGDWIYIHHPIHGIFLVKLPPNTPTKKNH